MEPIPQICTRYMCILTHGVTLLFMAVYTIHFTMLKFCAAAPDIMCGSYSYIPLTGYFTRIGDFTDVNPLSMPRRRYVRVKI